jgi:hypothetical protein
VHRDHPSGGRGDSRYAPTRLGPRHTVATMTSVPSDYASRKRLWIQSGLWLSYKEGPFVTRGVEILGYAERQLLEWEERIAANDRAYRAEREGLIMECAAHSVLWVFGLYEIVRVVKDTSPSRYEALEKLFEKLEVLRMPLAKHEVKSAPKYRNTPHYPTGFWCPDSGSVGWKVRDPRADDDQRFTRSGIADEFLSITATEPIFTSPPCIGRQEPRR